MQELTAYELAKKIEAKEISAREAAEAANARVEEVEEDVNAFVTTTPELALERADRIDERLKNGGLKLWEGVPLIVKDVLSTRGVRTTCGSRILENFEPLYDASALQNFGEDMVVGRQGELRRVRDGLFDRELSLRADKEPVGPEPGAGRFFGGISGGGGRR